MTFVRSACLTLMMASLAMLASCSSCNDGSTPPTREYPLQVASGFDFVQDSFSFENFGGDGLSTQLTPRMAERMFGAEAVCIEGSDPCSLQPTAQLWLESTNETLDQGRSEGFAILSLLFFMGELDPKDFGADTVAELELRSNVALQEELAYWASTQAVATSQREDVRYEARDVMPFLAEALAPEGDKRYRLAIAQKTGAGFRRGHALTPIGYFRDADEEDTYWLRVYDNNFPQREQLLKIEPGRNAWSYEISGVDGTPIVYEGSDETKNFMYFASVTSRAGTLPTPFAEDSEYMMQTYSGVTIVAANEDGEETGIRGGEVLEADGDWVMPAFSSCPLCGNAVAIVNQATLAKGFKPKNKITISATDDAYGFGSTNTTNEEDGGVSIKNFGYGHASTVSSGKPEVGDTVTFDGGDVTYTSETNDGGVTISTTVVDGAGKRVVIEVTVEGSTDASGVEVEVTKGADGTPTVSVSGLEEGRNVSITATTKQGTNETKNEFNYTSNGEDAKASVGTSDSTITLDTTPSDAAICKNGTKDRSETDVDCGGSCGATCVLQKACENDGDCTTGYCEGGACDQLDPMCSSGTQSPGETGPDCGGDVCEACVATAGADSPGCLERTDCDTGLCRGGQCRIKYPIYVEFDRKPEDYFYIMYVELDGVNKLVSGRIVDGTQRYKIGDAYDFKFVQSNFSCDTTNTRLQVAGPTAAATTSTDGTLELTCPEDTAKNMIVRVGTSALNTFATDPTPLEVFDTDSTKLALRVDNGPIQIVALNKNYMNLGTYEETWAVAIIQQPQADNYPVSYWIDESRTSRMALSKDYVSSQPNRWTDDGLFVVDEQIPEVRYRFRQHTSRWSNVTSPGCSDRVHNQDETSTDCGGSCGSCVENRLCLQESDCGAGLKCLNNVCKTEGTCSDSVKNQDESGADCGGLVCTPRCAEDVACALESDCAMGLGCVGGLCKQPCSNGLEDVDETDVDCGGATCSARCGRDKGCAQASDCANGDACVEGLCKPVSCSNDVKDADESDVDCGGASACARCERKAACSDRTDCASGDICWESLCVALSCIDGRYTTGESDQDCGGPNCGPCNAYKRCEGDDDCVDATTCESNIDPYTYAVCISSECSNMIKDAGESDVDCGGSSVCRRCDSGETCAAQSDCFNGRDCYDGVCDLLTCRNGSLDASRETDVDCGNLCTQACETGERCLNDTDCATNDVCLNAVCTSAACVDNTQQGNEADVDCGGTSGCGACADGKRCDATTDCEMDSACISDVCQPSTCTNTMTDGFETDVDCGGDQCTARCGLGLTCVTSTDCVVGGACDNGTCANATCLNNVKDADESGIDCGGTSSCGACANGQSCALVSDCVMGSTCLSDVCQPSTCENTQLDANETGPDCGGPECSARCALGVACAMNTDCASGAACVGSICTVSTCANGTKDADESDVDCGGSSSCPRCDPGEVCTDRTDCASNAPCVSGACAPLTCANGMQDGNETGIDCGGADCGPCGAQACTLDSDCASSDCECGADSGNCSTNSGRCGSGQFFIDQPVTDGTTASGTYTIPAGCDQIYVQAWGAAGGAEDQMSFPSTPGGSAGYVDGTLDVTPGDTVTVWLGQGGTYSFNAGGAGSYLGTSASGGAGGFGMFGSEPGGGGGLTSVEVTGTSPFEWSVPGGAGGAQFGGTDVNVTLAGTGGASGNVGDDGSNDQGGGGAGDPGGLENTAGAYGPLPSGLTGYDADDVNMTPAGTSNPDYSRCQGANMIGAGASDLGLGYGGDGCVILRCVGQ